MRITKAGKRNRQDLSIQDFPHVDADPRQMLWWETKHYLAMLKKWGGNSKAASIAKAACRNLLEQLKQEQS